MDIRKDNIEDILPLSPMQKGIFYDAISNNANDSYFNQISFKLEGDLDPQVLKKSFQALCDRHKILRSVFVQKTTEEPLQIVIREREADFRYVDLTEHRSREKALAQYKVEDARASFDIQRDKLIRMRLIKLQDKRFELGFSFHHIILDGWCSAILYGDLLSLYTSLVKKEKITLPPPAEFREYLKWLEKVDRKSALIYWDNVLRGYSSDNFVFGKAKSWWPRMAQRDKFEFQLGDLETEKLVEFAKEHKVTLHHLVSCVWAIVLANHNRTNDIVFGTVVSGRPPELKGVDRMLGVFMNTIPVRVMLNSKDTFVDLVTAFRDQFLDGLPHHYLNIAEILSTPGLKSDLINHVVVVENFPVAKAIGEEAAGAGIAIESDESLDQSNYDFSLNIIPGERIVWRMLYNSDQYGTEVIKTIATHIRTVVQAILTGKDIPVAQIHLGNTVADEATEASAQVALNNTINATIKEVFEQRVAESPDATALIFGDKRYSYAALNQVSNQLARHLQEMYPLRPGDLIAVCVKPSDLYVIGILAVLKLDGVYVPVEPDSKKERLEYIINDTQAKLVITDSPGICADFPHHTFLLDDAWESIEKQPTGNLESSAGAMDPCYVMYTSGSTGMAKGVLISNRGVVRLVSDPNYILLNSASKLLLTGATSFDATTFEIWGMLMNGGELHLLSKEQLLDVAGLCAYIEKNKINTMWFTASLFNQMVDTRIDLFGHLGQVIVGGEQLSVRHIGDVRTHFPRLQIINGYGPTENTTFSLCHRISEVNTRGIPIGTPISGSAAHVMDADRLTPVPDGVEGEIFVGGQGLALGYLNSPELTGERFLPIPFFKDEIYYKTNDIGKVNQTGAIEFIRRNDQVLKIRGFRLDPFEIETKIKQSTWVKDAHVIGVKGRYGDTALYAFVMLSDDVEMSQSGPLIKAYCRENLPAFMMPTRFIQVTRFPLNKNGKIDQLALAESIRQEDAAAVEPGATFGGLEKEVYAIWCELLETTDIQLSDSFVGNGGHSLLGVQLVHLLQKKFEFKLSISTALDPVCTIEYVAKQIRDHAKSFSCEIPKIEIESAHYPLSPAQRRIWLQTKIEKENSVAYNIPVVISVSGDLRVSDFENALKKVVERHESLRTVFREKDDGPVQVIKKTAEVDLRLTYLSRKHLQSTRLDIDQFFRDESEKTFDLEQGPLIKTFLVELAESKYQCLFVFHHIIFDRWSFGIFFRDVLAFYKGETEKSTSVNLPDLRIQYKDYAQWMNAAFDNMETGAGRNFWLAQFPEIPEKIVFPKEDFFSEHLNAPFAGMVFNKETSNGLRQISSKSGSTLFMTLLALTNVLLSRITGHKEIVIGAPVTERVHPDLANQVGFFLNMLALKNRVDTGKTFVELLKNVSKNTLECFQHHIYPYDQLLNDLAVRTNRRSVFQLFNVVLIVTNDATAEKSDNVSGLEFEVEDRDWGQSKYDLSLTFAERNNGIEGKIDYNPVKVSHFFAHSLARQLETLAAHIARDGEQSLQELDILTPSEKNQLLRGFDQEHEPLALTRTCLDVFNRQVVQQGDKPILFAGHRSFTYKELERFANKLSSQILGLGIGEGHVVALQTRNREILIIGMLALWKIGAVYLPLDVTTPEERLRYCLNESNAVLLMSDDSVSPVEGLTIPVLRPRLNELEAYPDEHGYHERTNESPAYIMFTSGSTGKPKGVVISHRSLLNFIYGMNKDLKIDDDAHLLSLTSPAFDISLLELIWTLCNGIALSVIDKSANLIHWAHYAKAETDRRKSDQTPSTPANPIDSIQLTPSLLKALLKDDRFLEFSKSLRYLVVGGEKLEKKIIEELKLKTKAVIYNVYGPTETTIWSTIECVSEQTFHAEGKAIVNTSLYVIDEYNRLQPIGVSGELLVGGEGLALGYLNDPERTNEKFASISFDGETTVRCYRTGDLARRLADGRIEILGRRDDQLKIRGVRIEPGEVRDALLGVEGVVDAVVAGEMDEDGQRELVAYCVLEPGFDAGAAANHIKKVLPAVMYPSRLYQIDSIPLTNTGKINKNKLAAHVISQLAIESEYEDPITEKEKMLAKLWSELFKLDRIGRHDNFFEMGGDSLKAIRLSSAMAANNYSLAVEEILESPDLKAMAEAMEQASPESDPLKLMAAGDFTLSEEELDTLFDD